MRIRIEIEANDLVRAAQKMHKNLSHDTAKQLLVTHGISMQHSLEDLCRQLAVRAVEQHFAKHTKEAAVANT